MVSPTLAQKLTDKDNVLGWYASEKLDGVRALFDGEKFYTRNGKVLDAPYHFIAAVRKNLPSGVTLDGELYLGRGRFDECSGIVRRHGDEWFDISYCVFDLFIEDKPTADWEQRQELLLSIFAGSNCPLAGPIPQYKISSMDFLVDFNDQITRMGGEGTMIRNPVSPYEQKRTKNLLKMKKFHDLDAVCIGTKPGVGKYTGKIGSLICRVDGNEFDCGSGLTDADRDRDPDYFIGETIIVKYFELTKAGVPRFPIYQGIRADG